MGGTTEMDDTKCEKNTKEANEARAEEIAKAYLREHPTNPAVKGTDLIKEQIGENTSYLSGDYTSVPDCESCHEKIPAEVKLRKRHDDMIVCNRCVVFS